MKKLVVVLAVVIMAMVASPSFAVEWHPDGSTIAWARPGLENGNPLPPGDGIIYEVSQKHETTGEITVLGTTQTEEYVVNLIGADAYFFAGVRGARIVNGTQLKWGGYTWSDDTRPEYVSVPFGLTVWLQLDAIRELRHK